MTPIRLLLSDQLHFHHRNFGALFHVLEQDEITWEAETSRKAWWGAHGDYAAFKDALAPWLDRLNALDDEALLAFPHDNGTPLSRIAFAELMALLLPRAHWVAYRGESDARSLLRRALRTDRTDTLLCLAAAGDWLDFWGGVLADWKPTHVATFSGSPLYARALLAVAEIQGIPAFVLESFFTGNEFYMERRYTPLPNNSQLRDFYLSSVEAMERETPRILDELRHHAHRRLKDMRNKNVAAVDRGLPHLFAREGRSTVLVIGQVVNDYSLIETRPRSIFAIPFYEDLIHALLKAGNVNVVFKAHPWERRRVNVRAPLTLERIKALGETLTEEEAGRFRILETESIRSVFRQIDHVVGLCSQGALEACQAGFKPAMFGNPFFGGLGFTTDWSGREDIDAYVEALSKGRLDGSLTLEEYRRFEGFLIEALSRRLASGDPRGERVVRTLLRDEGIPLSDAEIIAFCAEMRGRPSKKKNTITEIRSAPGPWLRDAYWKWKRSMVKIFFGE